MQKLNKKIFKYLFHKSISGSLRFLSKCIFVNEKFSCTRKNFFPVLIQGLRFNLKIKVLRDVQETGENQIEIIS